jgi:hypothetical protein
MTPLRRTLRRGNSKQRICPLCNEPLLLETCKTDEKGQATHEECYVGRICSQLKRDDKKTPREKTPPLREN